MSEKFTLYDDSKYENHATNELPLASKNMSKKEEKINVLKELLLKVDINSRGYKAAKSALEWHENNQELDTVDAFETGFGVGWDAAIKEIKVEIERRRNESTWAEYNEALDDMLSFIDTMEG